MSRYLLECPDCGAREELKRYAPERWARCAACGAMMIVPRAPGDGPAPPRRSLRGTAACAALLTAAALGAALWLARAREARLEARDVPVERPLTPRTLPAELHAWALPLGRGFSWEYVVSGGGIEVREVLRAWEGPDGAPEFELGVRGGEKSTGHISPRYRVTKEGLRLLAENGRELATPPLVLPHPLYGDSVWSAASEDRNLACRATAVEKLRVPAGEFGHAVRVEMEGVIGGRCVKETHWYVRGVGLVKRESEGGTAELKRFVKGTGAGGSGGGRPRGS